MGVYLLPSAIFGSFQNGDVIRMQNGFPNMKYIFEYYRMEEVIRFNYLTIPRGY